MTGRVLFYVQSLLGVGHLRRAEILAEAMQSAGLEVTVALGGKPIPEAPFRGIPTAALPPAIISGEDFSKLLDEGGKPVDDEWRTSRREALLGVYEQLNPDIVLIELFPFGRRQFRFELIPLLEMIRAAPNPCRVACSVRDILVASKQPGREGEIVETLRRFFDAVLVHGDPTLIPFEATFSAAAQIGDLIHYTGYVTLPPALKRPAGSVGEVLVSAGGGAVGGPLLFTAMQARQRTAFAEHTWRFLTGPNLAEADFERLVAMGDHLTIVERFRDDFPGRLAGAALSISQAGYNTTMDILRSGARAVVVPFETPSETEQRRRADLLARTGALTVVPAAELSADRLARAIAETLSRPASSPQRISFSGAARTAELVAELAGLAETRSPRGRG